VRALRCDAVRKKEKVGRAIRAPIGIELNYQRFILAQLRELDNDIRRVVDAEVAGWVASWSAETGVVVDSSSDDIGSSFMAITERMLSRLSRNAPPAVEKTARDTSEYNKRQWRATLQSAYGIDVVRAEPWLRDSLSSWEKENLNLITNMSQNRIAGIRGIVQRAVTSGTRASSIVEQVSKSLDVGKGRAKTIARDQVSKLNANLTQVRQRNSGVEEYEWSTSRDERVRPTHRANEGKRFKWSEPPAETGHPSHDINCRCVALPILPDIEEMLAEAGLSE
jgi:SPP1 gp7 family putative phage head morphogenesis protein